MRLGGGGGGNVVAVVDIVIVEALSDDSRGRFLDAEVALFPSTALVVVEVLVAPAEAETAEVAVVGPPLVGGGGGRGGLLPGGSGGGGGRGFVLPGGSGGGGGLPLLAFILIPCAEVLVPVLAGGGGGGGGFDLGGGGPGAFGFGGGG